MCVFACCPLVCVSVVIQTRLLVVIVACFVVVRLLCVVVVIFCVFVCFPLEYLVFLYFRCVCVLSCWCMLLLSFGVRCGVFFWVCILVVIVDRLVVVIEVT